MSMNINSFNNFNNIYRDCYVEPKAMSSPGRSSWRLARPFTRLRLWLDEPRDHKTDALFKPKEFHRGLTLVLSVRPPFLEVGLGLS
jgi:hypothetical protein